MKIIFISSLLIIPILVSSCGGATLPPSEIEKDQEDVNEAVVTDSISVSYGEETIDSGEQTVDAEYSQLSVSYTSGGMTITAKTQEAENISYTTGSTEDQHYWGLTLAFAF